MGNTLSKFIEAKQERLLFCTNCMDFVSTSKVYGKHDHGKCPVCKEEELTTPEKAAKNGFIEPQE